MIVTNLYFLYALMHSPYLLLIIVTASFIVKLYFLYTLFPKSPHHLRTVNCWLLSLCILGGAIFGDIAWMAKVIQHLFIPTLSYAYVTFFIRIAWGCTILQYQSLALFLQTLVEKKCSPTIVQKILLFFSCGVAGYFFLTALFDSRLTDELSREIAKHAHTNIPLEIRMMRYTVLYLLNILIIPGLYVVFKKTYNKKIPSLLRKQIRLFLRYMICPYLLTEFIQTTYLVYPPIQPYILPIVNLSTILLAWGTYTCMTKLLHAGLLQKNGTPYDETIDPYDNDLKEHIDALGSTNTTTELINITSRCIEKTCQIAPRYITINIRDTSQKADLFSSAVRLITEKFLACHAATLETTQILVYDTLAYKHFYAQNDICAAALDFLEAIDADVFLPIYVQNTAIAYIIIKKHAGLTKDRYCQENIHKILIFARYVAHTLHLLQNNNIEHIRTYCKKLEDTLHAHSQHSLLYKENLKAIALQQRNPTLGILFYQNRHFFAVNKEACDLLKIDLNKDIGHPLTKHIRQAAFNASLYKQNQASIVDDQCGRLLRINITPYLEKNKAIITISSTSTIEALNNKFDMLQTHDTWEYMLYLNTTRVGSFINQIIPSDTVAMTQLKASLLKTITSHRLLFLHASLTDLPFFIEEIHALNKHDMLQVITIDSSKKADVFDSLFSPDQPSSDTPLPPEQRLKKTVVIQNMHLATHKIQLQFVHLLNKAHAERIHEQNKISDTVYIISSDSHSLAALISQDLLIPELYLPLQSANVEIPTLGALSHKEIDLLIEGFANQLLKKNVFSHMLELSSVEKQRILRKEPQGLYDLKSRVHGILSEKIIKHPPLSIEFTDAGCDTQDHELIHAARLGKQALKDQRTMEFLWRKFKNQNKIATLLHVNRSSVNRRCKEYNLIS